MMTESPYLSWLGHGAACLSPPGVFTDARATLFVIDADRAAMQSLADTLLNPAGRDQVRYEPLLPMAMISFMDIARCTSGTDVVGWLPGRECALWVPLIELHAGQPLRDRVVFWSPYIFIDYAIGMVTGREIWGWPKVLADISMPTDDPTNPRYGCATTYFPTLSKDTRGVTGTLFQVTPNGGPDERNPEAMWRSVEDADDALRDALLGGVRAGLRAAGSLLPCGPCIALKQFRDASDPQSACYQAICDSPVEVTAFKGGGLLEGDFTLQVTTCESHAIVRDLTGRAPGPETTTLPIKLAAWSLIDFKALSGGNIVVAG